jgi:uncharacterized protein (DUF1015 family)
VALAQIRPFAGIRYGKQFTDVSSVIAPPYDVLDEAQKAAFQAKHPNNIVTVDLPWMPPKTVGPDDVYQKANVTLQAWLSSGVLTRDRRPALYPYTQSFDYAGKTFHRRGFVALVKLTPFGQDVIPHEKTYKGPIEDRLKLMRATGMQLSPIFGLFSDPRSQVTSLLYSNAGRPQQTGMLGNVKNDLWSVIDAEVEIQIVDLMKARNIYIADGHHRYTTALQFQAEAIAANGGKPLPPAHPANYCMFVLVGMQDDGLLILPTHRLIGGMDGFDMQIFSAAVKEHFDIEETKLRPEQWDDVSQTDARRTLHEFAMYVGATRKLYTLRLKNLNVLQPLEPNQSESWRRLDVAILQRYLLDEVLHPEFASPNELTRGYTADAATIAKEVDGKKYQVALMLRPTPLPALEELGKHGEVMPQKSTYFYPKLATGLVMNPLV